MRVLLTGATGLVGRELGKELVRRGHGLVIVSRDPGAVDRVAFPCDLIVSDLTKEKLSPESLRGVDAVIHLLGEGIAEHRWTKSQKAKLESSRILSSQNLLASLAETSVRHVLSASAIGYYGDQPDNLVDEDAPPGTGFLAQLCLDWETPFRTQRHFRWVGVRIGVVLDAFGGALGEKLIPLFRRGLGAPVGSGKQWMSWIALPDLVNLFCFCLENEKVHGIVNGVSPHPERNREFSLKLAEALDVSLKPTVPATILRVAYGEMSQVMLTGQRVRTRASELGFSFQFPTLEDAFRSVKSIYGPRDEVFFAEQYFDRPLEDVFGFFSDAQNLERITPPLLNFQIEKMSTEKIQEKTRIDYRLKIHQWPVHWQTLIEEWNPPHEFVDTQIRGPYGRWIHRHTFEKLGERGTLVRDFIRYRLPLGQFGKVVAGSFVAKDVKKIFSFRRTAIANLLGTSARGVRPTTV